MRPRCCLRYLTFFGINMMSVPYRSHCLVLTSQFVFSFAVRFRVRRSGSGSNLNANRAARTRMRERSLRASAAFLRAPRTAIAILLVTTHARHQALALVEPHLHANLSVGRARFREAVVDVGPQRLQRQLAMQVPFGPRDFRTVQPAADA